VAIQEQVEVSAGLLAGSPTNKEGAIKLRCDWCLPKPTVASPPRYTSTWTSFRIMETEQQHADEFPAILDSLYFEFEAEKCEFINGTLTRVRLP
jgi:hypothetical protein